MKFIWFNSIYNKWSENKKQQNEIFRFVSTSLQYTVHRNTFHYRLCIQCTSFLQRFSLILSCSYVFCSALFAIYLFCAPFFVSVLLMIFSLSNSVSSSFITSIQYRSENLLFLCYVYKYTFFDSFGLIWTILCVRNTKKYGSQSRIKDDRLRRKKPTAFRQKRNRNSIKTFCRLASYHEQQNL